jgi:hypothetical protein
MSFCARRMGIVTVGVLLGSTLIALAADEKQTGNKSDEIKIALKDFKFKPPESVSDPDSVFVFDEDGDRLCFYTDGPTEAKFKVPSEGDWDFVIAAAGDTATGVHLPAAGGEKIQDVHPNFQFGIDGKNVGKEITLKSDDKMDYKVTVPLKAGEHKVSIAFTNDTYKDGEYDSNLYLYGVKLMPHKTSDAKSVSEKPDIKSDSK